MAAGRLDIPAIVVTGGPMLPGYIDDSYKDFISVSEGVGAHRIGQISDDDLKRLENFACNGIVEEMSETASATFITSSSFPFE